MSLLLKLGVAALLSKQAAGDFQPCGPKSASCCDPQASPAQNCPGGLQCQPCGGGSACECPATPPPSPAPPPGPTSLERLTIVNGCPASSLWIAHIAASQIGPDPQDVKIDAGGSARFHTSVGGGGLSAARFWPKLGCDSAGNNCYVGDSGGPGEGCVIRVPGQGDDYSHCAPPVDTKFEATFAAPGKGVMDVVDMSLVDGYTLPFKLETTGGSCVRAQKPFESMDCSGLSFQKCPAAEKLDSKTVSLHAVSPKTGKQAGCFSPCMRLTDDKWNTSTPLAADSGVAGPYCCAGAFGSPAACRGGSILQTEYLKAVRDSCPGAYGYAYDDVTATIACPTSTEYKLTFYCPTDSSDTIFL